ncbi:MAG TPA: AraC family transcriptional regulator [Mobilitalea sp.]|nr:AraC family transcriptional regulator [Mobilitalea sp.]
MKIFYERKGLQFHVFQGENLTFPSHLHKEIEFVMCLEGELEVSCNEKLEVMKPYDFMLAFPNTVHSYNAASANRFILGIVATDYLPLFKDYFLHEPETPFIKSENTHLFRNYVILLSDEYEKDRNKEIMVGYMHLILAFAVKELVLLSKKQPKYDDILPNLLLYLDDNFKNNLSLEDLASHFGLNSSYLSRLLSTRLNCTFTHYLQELRIEYAKYLLNTSTLSITQIAFESGFSTQRSFNRTFSEIVKIPPREYKAKSTK